MISETLSPQSPVFTTHDAARPRIEDACGARSNIARFEVIGRSESGREMYGVVMGRGAKRVSLVAGAHADEPVGPQTLRHFVTTALERRQALGDLFERFTFVVVPHVNPDGEAANWAWIEQWPDPLAYIKHVVREPPGRDIEFGYPAMRVENRAVAAFLERHGPFDLHMSLHGMAVADGAWLLIEKHWIDRTPAPGLPGLRQKWTEAVHAAGLRLFDWDRKGDKGFIYIGPGFSTTPEGAAMRAHFEAAGDPATAALFHQSSMEYVRSLGGDPLCLVTELPLFVLTRVVEAPLPGAGEPRTYFLFKEQLPRLRLMIERGDLMEALRVVEPFGIEPLDLATAMRLQFRALELGLECVNEE